MARAAHAHRPSDDEPAPARAPRAGLAGTSGGRAAGDALELDRLIHERMRLAILSALAGRENPPAPPWEQDFRDFDEAVG